MTAITKPTPSSNTSLEEFVSIPLSEEDERITVLSDRIYVENISLVRENPSRFSILTQQHCLIAVGTSVSLIAVGILLMIILYEDPAAVYTGGRTCYCRGHRFWCNNPA